jgi:hypothetical protein
MSKASRSAASIQEEHEVPGGMLVIKLTSLLYGCSVRWCVVVIGKLCTANVVPLRSREGASVDCAEEARRTASYASYWLVHVSVLPQC